MSLPFKSPRVAHFRLEPSSGVLLPGHQQLFSLVFKPRQIGTFTRTVDLVLADETVTVPLKVRGHAAVFFRIFFGVVFLGWWGGG